MLGPVTVQPGQHETDHRPVTRKHATIHRDGFFCTKSWGYTRKEITSCMCVPPSCLTESLRVSLTRRGKYETESFQSTDLHTLMKPAIIGGNWFFFPLLRLSYNWVWTSSSGELIDLGLNSSLFSLENNYAVIGRAEENRWPPPPILHPSPLLPPVCYERNHFCCHLQSVPNNSLCFTEWEGGVRWKMSSGEVHEGVKLQTPLCPQPRASKGISSFIDRAAEFLVAAAAAVPTTSSSSLDCFCFQVTSYLLLLNFFNFSGLVVWRQKASPSAALWEMYINLSRETIQKKHIEGFSLSCSVGDTDPVNAPPPPPPPMQLHQMNNQINVLVH